MENQNQDLTQQLKTCKIEIDLLKRILMIINDYASPNYCGECRIAKYLAGNYASYVKQIPENEDVYMLSEKARTDAIMFADSDRER